MRWEGTDNDGPTPCIICGGFGSSFGAELRTFAGEYAAPTRSSAADEPAQLQTLSAEDTATGKRRTRQKDDKPSLDVYVIDMCIAMCMDMCIDMPVKKTSLNTASQCR